MREHSTLFRFTTRTVLATLIWAMTVPPQADAQPPAPPLPEPDRSQPNQSQPDPPSRVGRVAEINGSVSFHTQGDTQWTPAAVNYPVSTGDAYWTEPSAEAQLEIAASRIVLAGKTEFDFASLDASGLQGVAAQGEVYLHLRDLGADEAWSVQTPRGLLRLNGNGRYNVVVSSTEQPTLVTVVEGSADVEGPGVELHIESDETATIDGTDEFQGSVETAVHDAFLAARLDAERPVVWSPQIPPQVAAMPGGNELNDQGDWAEAPEYGPVWYPPVPSGWVPYREGRWAYVAPWGWTWVDDAPWGFAPSHYGRWVELAGRWAWTPGIRVVADRPVYAPALVTFLGIGAGVAVGAALAAGHVGWVPLGPREPFRPWYHASDRYVRNVNSNHVTNITNNVNINNFANRTAASSIPAEALIGSRPLRSIARPIGQQEFAAARPLVGPMPLRPTGATAGITPTVARQFNVPQTVLQTAPGPALHSSTSGLARPGGFAPPGGPRPVLPGYRPAATSPQTGGGGAEDRPVQVPAPIQTAPGRQPQGGPPEGGPLVGGQPWRAEPPHVAGPAHLEPRRSGSFEPGVVRQTTPSVATQPFSPARLPHPDGARSLPPVNIVPHQAPPRMASPTSAPLPNVQRPTPPLASMAVPQIQRPTPPPAVVRPEPPRFTPAVAVPQREPQHVAPPPPPRHLTPAALPQHAAPNPPRQAPAHEASPRRDKPPG